MFAPTPKAILFTFYFTRASTFISHLFIDRAKRTIGIGDISAQKIFSLINEHVGIDSL